MIKLKIKESIFEDKTHKHIHSCSFFPDHFLWLNLTCVCDIHDAHYSNHNVTRKEADIQLRINVQALREGGQITNGKYRYWITGWIMYVGVRRGAWLAW